MMAKKREESDKASPDKGLLKTALARFEEAHDAWSENRKLALKDIRFAAGEQWDPALKKKREDKGRPCLIVDKTAQYRRQVVNDGRQNRPSVKVRPVDDHGDPKVAEAYQGIIRHICAQSNADEAFDTALDQAVTGGFGFFRVTTDYVDDVSFDQDIYVRRIRNPLAVLLDPTAQAADGSDAEYGFVVDEMSKEDFKNKYPQAKVTDWKGDSQLYGEGWVGDLTVRICEYWYKELESETVYQLENGETTTERKYQEAQASGVKLSPVARKRESKVPKIRWCRMSGAEVLEKRDWAGKYIPIIPVYGTEMDIDGKVVYSGLIRAARDPQLLYNYSRSAFAERVALAPKAPWIAAEGQVEDNSDWKTANVENHSVLTYKPTSNEGHPVPPPQRVSAADIPAGFQADMQMSEHDIQSAVGMYSASLGAPSNEKSGRAIMARQREGDTATFHYQDNLNRAVRHLGRILVDLIPKIYDTKRVVRVLGEDGSDDMVQLNPDLGAPTAKIAAPHGAMNVFNLNVGRYDVDVSAGPSYTTKRQESSEAMIELAARNPAVWQTHGDLIVKSQDWPGAEEFAKRTKALFPPEIKALIAQESQEDGPSEEVQAVMAQAEQAVAQRDQLIEEMKAGFVQAKQQMDELKAKAEKAEFEKERAILQAQKAGLDRDIEKAKCEMGGEQQPTEPSPDAVLKAETDIITTCLSKGIDPNGYLPRNMVAPAMLETVAAALAGLQETIAAQQAHGQALAEAVQQAMALAVHAGRPKKRVLMRDPQTGLASHAIEVDQELTLQ